MRGGGRVPARVVVFPRARSPENPRAAGYSRSLAAGSSWIRLQTTAGAPVPYARRHMRRQLVITTVVIAATIGSAQALERGAVIEGPARVVDGDTIDVAGVRVRLHGVAAPERSEPGGAEATAALRQIIAGQVVRCSVTGEQTHGREVGTCWIGAQDIGAAIIAAGRARDCPRFSAGRYAAIERPQAGSLPLPRYCR